MALAKCRECDAQVSTEAASCPHCGVPRPTSGPAGLSVATSSAGGTVQQVIVVSATKSVGISILLTVLFGPLGMLYSTIAGAITMGIASVILGVITLGFGLLVTWPISIIWGAIATSSYNKRLTASAATQPQSDRSLSGGSYDPTVAETAAVKTGSPPTETPPTQTPPMTSLASGRMMGLLVLLVAVAAGAIYLSRVATKPETIEPTAAARLRSPGEPAKGDVDPVPITAPAVSRESTTNKGKFRSNEGFEFVGQWQGYYVDAGVEEKTPTFDIRIERKNGKYRVVQKGVGLSDESGLVFDATYDNGRIIGAGKAENFYKFEIPKFESLTDGTLRLTGGTGTLKLKRVAAPPRATPTSNPFVGTWRVTTCCNQYWPYRVIDLSDGKFQLDRGTFRSDGTENFDFSSPVVLRLANGRLEFEGTIGDTGYRSKITVEVDAQGEMVFKEYVGGVVASPYRGPRIH